MSYPNQKLMKAERWRQIDQLLDLTLEREPAERAAYLQQACAGDEALRKEVESLLAAYGEAVDFIESPALEVAADMLAKNQRPPVEEGQLVGPYQVLSLLGVGGMGEIYLAQDTRLERKIALKLLPAQFTADKSRLHRFIQEARAASALNHPNIITIYDIGQARDIHYIATEFIEGHTLRHHMRTEGVKLGQALEVATQVATALAAAHAAGIAHRDIKPENVMLRPDGLVKVLDFGLAKLTEMPSDTSAPREPDVSTVPGIVLGTPQYMSPEQARGLQVDGRSDIFSLGVVLYEMITRNAPFDGATVSDQIASLLMTEPPPLASYSAEFPDELQEIVSKALAKDRQARYQKAEELLGDLKMFKTRFELRAELETDPRPRAGKRITRSRPKKAIKSIAGVGGRRESGLARKQQTGKAIDFLAVLPLANASTDPQMEYLSDGITESIINSLSQLPKVRVMARSSVFRYKGQEADPQKVGRELKVSAVLMGRVLQLGDRLVIRMELVAVADGSQLWGEQYNRKIGDIFAVQEEISNEISEKLRLKLTGEEKKLLSKRYTEDTEAYQLYLKGRYYSAKMTSEAVNKSIEFFNQAIEKDPGYALAYAGLADTYFRGSNTYWPPAEAMPKAKAAAMKALEIDHKLAEGYAALGVVKLYYDWDWPGTGREYERALELNPGYALARERYSLYLSIMGRVDEAIAEMKRAQELDPLSININTRLGLILYFAHRYDEAIEQLQRTIDMEPRFFPLYATLGWAYEKQEEYSKAISAFQKAISLIDNPELRALLARAYALSGNIEEAHRILGELQQPSREKYISSFYIAVVYIALGEHDLAFEWLDKSFEDRSEAMATLKVDPKLDSLRSDPRFDRLLRRMKLAP